MSALLSLRGVTCRFGRFTALAGVDLELHIGQRHAIVGPNGAGKTTLLGAVAGTLTPTRGRIHLAGRDITGLPPHRRARLGIARTFQTPALATTASGLDNVILGAWPHTRHRWRRSVRRELALRALRHLDALGLGHLTGVPAGALSHGQRKLLEIAVAVAARPTLLLLDEPAAGLTAEDRPRLLECLRQLPAGTVVLLVEHHLDVVGAIADTVTELRDGQVAATGPAAGREVT